VLKLYINDGFSDQDVHQRTLCSLTISGEQLKHGRDRSATRCPPPPHEGKSPEKSSHTWARITALRARRIRRALDYPSSLRK